MIESAVPVLGMHRSGTSTVARILDGLGVNMGSRYYSNLNTNPTGHFEDVDFLRMNERILIAAGGDSAGLLRIPDRRSIIAASDGMAREVERLVSRKTIQTLWGWKDPRTCLTMEAYHPYLTNLRLVVVRRGAEDVARSLEERDGTPRDVAMRIIAHYWGELDHLISLVDSSRVVNLDYDELRNDPEATLGHMIRALDLEVSRRTLRRAKSMVLSPSQLSRARRRIDRRRRVIRAFRSVARNLHAQARGAGR